MTDTRVFKKMFYMSLSISHVFFCSSFAVILEKQIRIPRSLSVKAASVLKGFLNKVKQTRQISVNVFVTWTCYSDVIIIVSLLYFLTSLLPFSFILHLSTFFICFSLWIFFLLFTLFVGAKGTSRMSSSDRLCRHNGPSFFPKCRLGSCESLLSVSFIWVIGCFDLRPQRKHESFAVAWR